MIRYALKCSNDHRFESWFQSAVSFDWLASKGHLSCAVCGAETVQKDMMAPTVRHAPATVREARGSLTLPNTEIEKAIVELRRKVAENADYVGSDFATIARAIHEGDAPERAIWGEARPDEARALLEDGVPVAPLPFLPTNKAN